MSQIHSLFVQDAQGQYIVADDDTVVASALRIAESRNSHDGTSSYQMIAGMFRFVCCNGMVAGEIHNDVRVRHTYWPRATLARLHIPLGM